MTTAKFILHYIGKVRYLFLLSLLLFAMSFVCSRLSAYFSAELIGLVADKRPEDIVMEKFVFLLSALIITMMFMSLGLFLNHMLSARFMPAIIGAVNRDLFTQVHNHSLRFFNEEMSGVIIGKYNGVMVGISNIYEVFVGFMRIFLMFSVSLIIIAVMNVYLALFFMVVTVVFAFITMYARKRLISNSKRNSELEDETGGVLLDGFANALTVKSFGNLRYERRCFFEKLKAYLRFSYFEKLERSKTTYKNNTVYDVMSVSFYLGVFYTWYVAGLSVANLVFIVSTISVLTQNTKEFSYTMSYFFNIWGRLKNSIEFLYRPHEVVDAANAKKLKIRTAVIDFKKICYAYEGKTPLFDKFDLHIGAGEKIGLVGRSGSGKSTLIKLLARYYDLSGGKITIDGQDTARVTQDSLRQQIALIPQDPSLFNRSIMDNIRYGNVNATDEEVIAAAKQAYCHDFIMELEKGYESKVGEKGVMLSGGERQRIAIARAILSRAPILILDEATSALDSESEAYIQKSLQNLMKGKTVIAIAHRLSTLREMDRIIVMDKGKIIEQGTQVELMKQKGAFYGFYKMQSEGFLKLNED